MASGSQKVKTPAGWNATQGAWVKTASSTWKAVDQIYVKTPTGWNDASGQQSVQQPYPYIANSQTPYIANAQQPYPYIANAQTPYIADAQQPYPYIANAQSPYIAQARQPSTYQHRSPFTYQNPVNAQEPNIRNAQQPYPYIADAQSPYIANARQPSTYQHRSPFTYRNPVNAQEPNIRNAQQPAGYRNPVNGRQPTIKNAQAPFTYNARYPATYPANARQPFTYNARYPATYPANARQPFTYAFRSPFTYNFRSPYTYSYDSVHYTLSGSMTLIAPGGYSFYLGFTDGVTLGGSPTGVGFSPQSPTAGALYSGSNKIMIWKSAPSYTAMLTSDWILTEASPSGGTPWYNAGFTKIKISSPGLSETTFPITAPNGTSRVFSSPTWVTSGTTPQGDYGQFTIKFVK